MRFLVSGIATIVTAFAADAILAFGVLVGALLAIGDLVVLHVLIGKLIQSAKQAGLAGNDGATGSMDDSTDESGAGRSSGAGAALAVFGLVTKLGVLMALIYLSWALFGARPRRDRNGLYPGPDGSGRRCSAQSER